MGGRGAWPEPASDMDPGDARDLTDPPGDAEHRAERIRKA